GRQLRLPGALPVPADLEAAVVRVFAAVRDVVGRARAEAVVVARVDLAVPQVEDVAVAAVPIVVVGAVLQAVRVEAAELVIQAADGVGAGEEAVLAGSGEAVVARDVARLHL